MDQQWLTAIASEPRVAKLVDPYNLSRKPLAAGALLDLILFV